jgi:dTDP-4-amino-4,6-dideoxygalactose transaminase
VVIKRLYMMTVPFTDLKIQHRALQDELQQSWAEICLSAAFTSGPHVAQFEEAFAAFCEVKHAVGVASGTDALILALVALGIGVGDEVITAANSFVATAEAIAHVGARPVFADIDPKTYNIDIEQIESRVTPQTRAIIPVHLYGQPADMDPILEIAERHGLLVIEDAAQAHGARYKGRRVGSLGHAAGFSFYPSKNLGACGDGGAVVTNDDRIAVAVRKLRDHGGLEKYQHEVIGYTSRLDSLQAAVLLIKLKQLDKWNQLRQKHADLYNDLLSQNPAVVTPAVLEGVTHVYHLYVVRVEQGSRDDLRQYLANSGVHSGIHYPKPIHLAPAFSYLRSDGFPIAEDSAQKILSLPMYPELEACQIKHATEQIKSYSNSLAVHHVGVR